MIQGLIRSPATHVTSHKAPSRPCCSSAVTAAPTAAIPTPSVNERAFGQVVAELASLKPSELLATLQLRGLSTAGNRQEQEQRLAAFMADPAAFPGATYRPRPALVLGGRLFAGREQVHKHVKALLLALEHKVVEPCHRDFAFLRHLLSRHPNYRTKVQCPVLRFRVRVVQQADMPPYRMFEFQDSRGGWDDFSVRKCLGMPTMRPQRVFRDAMRYEVRQQLVAYRTAAAEQGPDGRQRWRCDCCGRYVRQAAKTWVDHAVPAFSQLVADFCATTALPQPQPEGRVPHSNRPCFTDEAWVAAWRAYHRKHVGQLQLRCQACARNDRAPARPVPRSVPQPES